MKCSIEEKKLNIMLIEREMKGIKIGLTIGIIGTIILIIVFLKVVSAL